jgi:hypothetical protein
MWSGDPVQNAEATIRDQIIRPGKGCYGSGLASDPKQAGRLVVRLRVAPSGEVDWVRVASNSGLLSDVVACIVALAEHAHFPPPGESGATISIPIKFVRPEALKGDAQAP